MVRVEELGRIQVSADILDYDVWRIAPAADGNVAIRQRKALKRGGIGAAHNVDTGAYREGQGGSVERLGARDVARESRGNMPLTCRGTVAQTVAKRRSRAGVDAERRRAFRR
jgi:hypothetical protein